MKALSWWRAMPVMLLLAACGCEEPPLIQVETLIHSDGSCERTIWQPRDRMLPDDALKPAWNARWGSVDLSAVPPELANQAGNAQPDNNSLYFSARGRFPSPAEIPTHFRLSLIQGREAPASELARSYECKDYGFVRVHRYRETLTNIVTRDSFLKARDEFLDLALPKAILGIERVYGKAFDVAGLGRYLRTDGRRFLEQAGLAFYETMARHMTLEEQAIPYAELARQFGLDLFDAAGNLVSNEVAQARVLSFLRHRIALGVRHRDGSRLTETEIRSLLDQSGKTPYSRAWGEFWKEHEKEFETQLLPDLIQMTGLYNVPFREFDNPRFAFDLHLPGQIVECSGTIEAPDHARWRFTGDRSFPDGYTMQARSIEIDLERQERVLGRTAITEIEQAESYIELVEVDRPLLDKVRKVHLSGGLKSLLDEQPRSAEDQARLKRLRAVLGLSDPVP